MSNEKHDSAGEAPRFGQRVERENGMWYVWMVTEREITLCRVPPSVCLAGYPAHEHLTMKRWWWEIERRGRAA